LFKTIIAITTGAALGAISRWLLGIAFNPLFSAFSAGILLANLLGGYLIGVVLYVISIYPDISSTWKLFLITGLLGSLTTFSSFSAEIFNLLQENKWGNALFIALTHLVGSISMTALGFMSATYLKKII
jgi:CrcB protein